MRLYKFIKYDWSINLQLLGISTQQLQQRCILPALFSLSLFPSLTLSSIPLRCAWCAEWVEKAIKNCSTYTHNICAIYYSMRMHGGKREKWIMYPMTKWEVSRIVFPDSYTIHGIYTHAHILVIYITCSAVLAHMRWYLLRQWRRRRRRLRRWWEEGGEGGKRLNSRAQNHWPDTFFVQAIMCAADILFFSFCYSRCLCKLSRELVFF